MHTKESILALLDSNDNAVVRAMFCIHNMRGFVRRENRLMADFVRQVNAGRKLSALQISVARKKVTPYAELLVRVANEKIDAAQPAAVPAAVPYNAAVSTDGNYRPYDARCLCENFDGERKCDWCEEREFDALIQEREREEERTRMAHKLGSW